jgi:hypothetical protein
MLVIILNRGDTHIYSQFTAQLQCRHPREQTWVHMVSLNMTIHKRISFSSQ